MMKKIIALITTGIIFTSFIATANAAEISISIKSIKQKLEVEDKVKIEVLLNTEETINAIEGRVIFPSFLNVEGISTTNSIISSWMIFPTQAGIEMSSGETYTKTSFSGAIPTGFSGEGELFSIVGTVKKPGNELIDVKDIKVLLNDGLGTKTPTTVKPQKLQVSAGIIYKEKIKEELKKNNNAYNKELTAVKEKNVLTKEFNKPTSRCEFIVMNGNKAKWKEKENWKKYENRKKSENFTDLDKLPWCVPYADYAFDNNIMKGNNKIFGATTSINRYEVAVVIANQIANTFEIDNIKDSSSNLTDDKIIPEWARASVIYLRSRGIFTGSANLDGTFTFRGADPIIKINAAIVLSRAFEYKGI